ncbi:uncharacterized protein LOC112645994 [Canis lupus dingo]|uniref:uncharacterized protein LOC112645994 n=1 Tax=Canis lupus dingo TaxID=286419 RepID=UPI0020C389B3|nr:uncharacterized protein LOC112645994 [Canis lupus dingo]XP_048961680.1 uncharacterized protein LOC112645994 [Canis lupus dingo]XP_048961681.1 uncharacterized protein LOC112645994 [Canis lupus dingo]XP_048961682.1 uncharacterized protein LOC112645994 [Canis lupus dingo]XP_048961683.1 uncharacterized protein LOC112645994 [Canis lupus dingo]XP_048961684.1 uncharacterized protein LOC112645994 [Canis lupus dingo]XP_048961685.1 uncharacterized protein LOC112645994 [Canis lupus dingo]
MSGHTFATPPGHLHPRPRHWTAGRWLTTLVAPSCPLPPRRPASVSRVRVFPAAAPRAASARRMSQVACSGGAFTICSFSNSSRAPPRSSRRPQSLRFQTRRTSHLIPVSSPSRSCFPPGDRPVLSAAFVLDHLAPSPSQGDSALGTSAWALGTRSGRGPGRLLPARGPSLAPSAAAFTYVLTFAAFLPSHPLCKIHSHAWFLFPKVAFPPRHPLEAQGPLVGCAPQALLSCAHPQPVPPNRRAAHVPTPGSAFHGLPLASAAPCVLTGRALPEACPRPRSLHDKAGPGPPSEEAQERAGSRDDMRRGVSGSRGRSLPPAVRPRNNLPRPLAPSFLTTYRDQSCFCPLVS